MLFAIVNQPQKSFNKPRVRLRIIDNKGNRDLIKSLLASGMVSLVVVKRDIL